MEIGHFKQKAPPALIFFVFSCILITTGLLYILEKSEAKAESLTYFSGGVEYIE